MEKQNRIYYLIARKLSNEASPGEISELNELIKDNPEFQYYYQVITNAWKKDDLQTDQQAEETFKRIHARIKKENPALSIKQLSHQTTEPSSQPKAAKKRKPVFSFLKWDDLLLGYFRYTWRMVSRNKAYSFINITGLATGMACTILILLLIRKEMSVDQFHKDKDRTYLLYNRATIEGHVECSEVTPMVLGTVLKMSYPEVEKAARVNWVAAFTLKTGDKKFQPEGYLADPDFLTMFDLPMLKGNPQTALNNTKSIVLTEDFAKDIFGNEEAMGKVIKIDSNAYFTVTGIMKHLPENTRFRFNYIVPFSYTKEVGWDNKAWNENTIVRTYVTLKPGVTEAWANERFRNIIKTHSANINNELFVHPMRKWHLWSEFTNGKITGGAINGVRTFLIIAAVILLIACINYMNLSTARSMKRAREVGIRKVVGAVKSMLVKQFIWESILYSFMAGIVALVLLNLCIGKFNSLLNSNISVPYTDPWFWLAGLGFILFTGLLAGCYPAFYLSAYKPISVLKGIFKGSHTLIAPRKILVVAQFTFAIAMIICTTVIYRQIAYGKQRDLGFNQENLAFTYVKGDLSKNYYAINEELMNTKAVTSITWTNSPILFIWSSDDTYEWNGKEPGSRYTFNRYVTDHDFIKTHGLTLLKGRDIDMHTHPDDSTAIILNEAAVGIMGLKDPVGQLIKNEFGTRRIVGVVKNFFVDPYQSPSPVAIEGPSYKNWFGTITFKLNPHQAVNDNLAKISAVFSKYNPDYTFDHYFMDQWYRFRFYDQKQQATLATIFASLAVFISCLGLFALSAYMAENRIKEIGVRKVLGASVAHLTGLLSKEFLKLVVLSFVIASPLAWWIMNAWLNDYAYHVSISWWIFVFTGFLSFFIAIATVSFQAIKASLSNPVKSLRNE